MVTLRLDGSLKDAFAKEFSATILEYASASALFADILLRVLESDIHAIDLKSFLATDVLVCQNAHDVQEFTAISNSSISDPSRIEKAWLQYYLPRVYVFLHTTRFSGKRLDHRSLSLLFDELCASGRIEASMLNKSVTIGQKQLRFFSRTCKNEDWYYDINGVLDAIEENVANRTKKNTIPLFLTIMKAIEPGFIDQLRANFGQQMRFSLMLQAKPGD